MSELTNSDPPEIIRKIALNVSKYGVFPGPYFPAFGLNAERYEVSLRIQSKCGIIRTRKNSVVMANRSILFQCFWSYSFVLVLEKQPEKLNFQSFFASKKPFGG